MIFYLHLSIFSLTLYLLPVGQKLVMIICLLKLNGASVFIFCGLGNIRIGRKSMVRLIFLSTVNIMNPIGYPTNVRCWKKICLISFRKCMRERERENIGKERKRIRGEIGVLFFNEKD